MDLSRLQIGARQRSPWEAVDLGFVVARQWFKPLFLVWAIPSSILFVLLTLIFWDMPWIASFVVWWLKPLFDRLPLHIASRRLFGEDVSLSQTWKAMPKLFAPQWFQWLTWRRLSPTRSHDLPITCLERLKGAQRSRRISVLHMTSGTPAMWLTVLCYHLEVFIGLAIVTFVFLLVPQNLAFNPLPWAMEGSLWFQRLFYLLYLISSMLVAPFYCMAGFMLYISRRIDLEAWDLEITFRNLVNKKSQSHTSAGPKTTAKPGPGLLLAGVLFSALFMGDSGAVYAQEPVGEPRSYLAREESKDLAEDVLAGEDFSRTREVSGWRFKESDRDEEADLPDWLEKFLDWLESIFTFDGGGEAGSGGFLSWLNLVVKILLIAAAVAAAAWILTMVARTAGGKGWFLAKSKQIAETPEVLFGLDVRPESMPDDVLTPVRELCARGDMRAALALLYGALLSRLIHDHEYRFYDGHTEWECAEIVAESAAPALKTLMFDSTHLWQQLAYAKVVPSSDQLEQLCVGWEAAFNE